LKYRLRRSRLSRERVRVFSGCVSPQGLIVIGREV